MDLVDTCKDKVASSIICLCARLEHEGQAKLLRYLLHIGDHVAAGIDGN